eukprot:g4724.t1
MSQGDLSQLQERVNRTESELRAMDASRRLAVEKVTSRANKALQEAVVKRQAYEAKLADLKKMEGGGIVAYESKLGGAEGIDSRDPEDLKLLAILKHFGGDEILKVVEETNDLQVKFEALKSKIKAKETELKLMKKQAHDAKRAVENDIIPLEKLLARLVEKEDELRQQIIAAGKQEALHAFLQDQQSQLEQERDLKRLVNEKEEELAQIRKALCEVDVESLNTPEEKERAKLYVMWKENLRKKHETLRTFRETQYRMLMAIKARRDTQYVVAELEKKAELDEAKAKAGEYKDQIAKAESRIKLLEQGMVKAGSAMRQFRKEFEQMRVAIMLDKTIKSTQMASLGEHKKRLQRAEELFQKLIETERKRIREEEAEKWHPRLDAAKKRMEQQLALQEKQSKKKMSQVAEALSKRYKEGFAPLLKEAEEKYNEESAASERLRVEIRNKEQCLKVAEEELRKLEKEVLAPQTEKPSQAHSAEMDKLNMELRALWVELKSDPDEVATFLSELDAIAPYSDSVLRLYEEEEALLSSAAPSRKASGGGGGK